ncbi:MAG: DUF763 domain-containing protein [Nitrospiraceae bacterium]|nr:DUF763 domain-containing protein [Nitrospiraceae bacterium]
MFNHVLLRHKHWTLDIATHKTLKNGRNHNLMLSGIANLPLHGGTAPPWLFKRMRKLSTSIAEVIINEYGENKLLQLLSDPYWFQSLGCVVGFDWHSSGLTTTLTGALRDLNKLNYDIKMAGGKGMAHKTLSQIEQQSESLNLREKQIETLKYASRMSAKTDSILIQDGFSLYHHTIFFTKNAWAVIQQGKDNEYARRYHIISNKIKRFTENPNNAIVSERIKQNQVLDLTNKENHDIQTTSLDIVKDNPKHLYKYFKTKPKNFQQPFQTTLDTFATHVGHMPDNKNINNTAFANTNINNTEINNFINLSQDKYNTLNQKNIATAPSKISNQSDIPEITFPKRHNLTNIEITERVKQALEKAYEYQPTTYEELISLKGIGKATTRALALISELIYGTPISWKDPAKYSYAHGGKDGIPYPVDRKTYDKTINYLKEAINESKLDKNTKLTALKRISRINNQ